MDFLRNVCGHSSFFRSLFLLMIKILTFAVAINSLAGRGSVVGDMLVGVFVFPLIPTALVSLVILII